MRERRVEWQKKLTRLQHPEDGGNGRRSLLEEYGDRLPDSCLDEDLAHHVRIRWVICDITKSDQERGPSPQILDGMGDTGRNDEAAHHPLWNEGDRKGGG